MFERDPVATASPPAGDPLGAFHPVVRAWFQSRFAHPTDAQAGGWPRIHAGETTLIAAPTGSGKTLAAFLVGIDQLIREAEAGELEQATRIVYVSPLKALSNDIQRNLEEPLAEIRALAAEMGYDLPPITRAVRTCASPPTSSSPPPSPSSSLSPPGVAARTCGASAPSSSTRFTPSPVIAAAATSPSPSPASTVSPRPRPPASASPPPSAPSS